MKSERCPACGSDMVDGFLIDRLQRHVSALPTWVAGEPARWWWGGLKLRGRERFEVLTRRCRRCGRLESFATAPTR